MSKVKLGSEVSRDAILSYVKKLLVELFEVPEERIKPETDLYHDLDIDSIDAIDLIVEAKELTGRKLDPESFKKVRTVDDLVTALYDLMN